MISLSDLTKIVNGEKLREPVRLKTRWPSLNKSLGGGLVTGRLVQIDGRSQIGKSALSLQLSTEVPTVYFDTDQKINPDYIVGLPKPELTIVKQNVNNENLSELLLELIKTDVIIVIDSLPTFGEIEDNRRRFNWLSEKFMNFQRALVKTKSILVVINQIRQMSTGKMYNPHKGCLDPNIKINMNFAERRGRDHLVYLNIEKNFWNTNDSRCTLLVKKNEIVEVEGRIHETTED